MLKLSSLSSWGTVLHRVPQSSILVPITFNMSMNDLFYRRKRAKLNAYADNHKIYYSDKAQVEEFFAMEVETTN